jgi:hypothetical protein
VLKTISVTQNLELLGKYRYVEIQTMELMGSWAYTMVEPEIKIGFGRQMYQDAVHADMLGKRLPELKGRSEHFHYIAPSDEFVRLLEKIWRADDLLRRMVALYRVLKPAVVAAYNIICNTPNFRRMNHRLYSPQHSRRRTRSYRLGGKYYDGSYRPSDRSEFAIQWQQSWKMTCALPVEFVVRAKQPAIFL